MISNSQEEFTEEEFVRAAEDIKSIDRISDRAVGKLLIEAKQRIPHGRWDEFLKNTNYSQNTAALKMKFYREYENRDIPDGVTETHLIELVKGKSAYITPMMEAINTIYSNDKNHEVKPKDLRILRNQYKDRDDITVEEVISGLKKRDPPTEKEIQEQKEMMIEHNKNYLAYNIIRLSVLYWRSDSSVKEIVEAIKEEKGNIAKLQNLKFKLEQIFKEMEIE